MCVLVLVLICHPLRHKAVAAMTVAQSAVMLSDGITTRERVRRGATEDDPLAELVIGKRPTWTRMAPAGFAVTAGSAELALRMRRSRNWTRHLWWLPQVLSVAGNGWGIAQNERGR